MRRKRYNLMFIKLYFNTDRQEYIINDRPEENLNLKKFYKYVMKNEGEIIYQKKDYPIYMNKIYIKWYNYKDNHEYSMLNNYEEIKIQSEKRYKSPYGIDFINILKYIIIYENEENRERSLKFEIILDMNYNVIAINPCDMKDILITRCMLQMGDIPKNIIDYTNEY